MMKSNYKNIAIAMAITSFTAIGCGSAPAAIPAGPAAIAPAAINPAGMVGNGQCVPIGPTLAFQANQLYTDNFENIGAGTIPMVDPLAPGRQFGQVMPTLSAAVGALPGAATVRTSPTGVHPDGSMVMNISEAGLTATGGYTTGNGIITFSSAKLSIIYGLFGLSYPSMGAYAGAVPQNGFPNMGMSFNTPGMTPAQLQAQSPCVSAMAISLSFASLAGNLIDGGRVYLYLNNTAHGDYLQF